jgi:hypothetical protein
MRITCLLMIAAAAVVATSCDERKPAPRAESARSCDAPGVRAVVEQLGERMKRVSLLAPDSVLAREIRQAYAPLVTPDLLAAWIAEPARAPGRDVSSPWPERIDIRTVEAAGTELCRVEGDLVYVTSAELTKGGAAVRKPVVLEVRSDGAEWRISAYEAATASATDSTATDANAAADVIRRYYAAINARDFRRAYTLWSGGGAASRQTLDEFSAGFARTARVRVEVGKPGRVDPAAGSRYVEIPVVVRAVTDSGDEQQFKGPYVLRRGVVDGASADERRWQIYSANLVPSR